MKGTLDEAKVLEIRTLLYSYFPDCRLQEDTSALQIMEGGEVLYSPEQILPYIQTVLFEEHLLELELDQSTRIFYANLLDEQPYFPGGEGDEGLLMIDPEYETGSYLKSASSMVLTPLTPAIGNARICNSRQVIVRYFSNTTAIELGCTFDKKDIVGEVPVLRFNFPVIGRINRSYRRFRVKAVSTVDAQVFIQKKKGVNPEQNYQMVDVSGLGMAFQIAAEQQPFEIGELIHFKVKVEGINNLDLKGNVRHISKVRDKAGYKNICGVQFDLETRALAAEIERLAAAIQRLQLREIAERTADLSGVELVR